MVGTEVYHAGLEDPRVTSVTSIVRKPLNPPHTKAREIVHADFKNLAPLADALRDTDLIAYCIGLYTGRAPDDEFIEVTCNYLERLLAVLARTRSRATFCLFSAQGADQSEQSRLIFARAKGRAEKMLLSSSLPAKYIFRPGYIAPGRTKSRTRIPDWLALPVYRIVPWIGVSARDLARVMIDVGITGSNLTIFENRDIRAAAARLPR
jgi:uncharacterized protein YbjT (DUF2867 family)